MKTGTVASIALQAATAAAAGVGSLNGYWGQEGFERLRDYCDSQPEYVTLAFVNRAPEWDPVGYPGTNFAGHCWADTYVGPNKEPTKLLSKCENMKLDIPYCRDKGVKVLLSIGGHYNTEDNNYLVTSVDRGTAFANFLYSAFGPKAPTWTGPRPFDIDATTTTQVDGFDFDLELPGQFNNAPYIRMAERFRELDRSLFLTAAPQCPTSDKYFNMKDFIKQAPYDALFVQFYNNEGCDAIYDPSSPLDVFNYDSWATLISQSNKSKNAKLFVGLPASTLAAGSGYLSPTALKQLVCSIKDKKSFGGVSLWDLTRAVGQLENGKTYYQHALDALKYGCSPVPTTTSTTIVSTTTSRATTTSRSSTSVRTTSTSTISTKITTSTRPASTSTRVTSSTRPASTSTSTKITTSTRPASTSTRVTSSTRSASTSTKITTSTRPASSSIRSVSTSTSSSSVIKSSTIISSTRPASTSSSTKITTSTRPASTSTRATSTSTSSSSAIKSSTIISSSRPASTSTLFSSSIRSSTTTSSSAVHVLTTGSTVIAPTSSSVVRVPTVSPSTTLVTSRSTDRDLVVAPSSSSSAAPVTSGFGLPDISITRSWSNSTFTTTSSASMTTSTVYTTSIRTITSCAPDVPNCPNGGVHVVTETIPLYTTVCPVTPEPTEAMTTSTVYATSIYTVGCPDSVPNCPAGHVTTETRAVYTTVCPVGEDVSVPLVTSTAYATEAYTVTACADDADCSVGAVTTATRAFTTIHPAEETAGVPKPVPEVVVAVPELSPSSSASSQPGAAASTGFSHSPTGPSGTPNFPEVDAPSSASTIAVGLGGLMALVALQLAL